MSGDHTNAKPLQPGLCLLILDFLMRLATIPMSHGAEAMRLVQSCLLTVAGSILGAALFVAQADDATPITQLQEKLDPQAIVSLSGRIFGVIERSAFDGGFDSLGTSLEAYTTGSGQLCMHYRSRNGLYTAQQNFEVAGRGWTGVTFETDHAGTLRRLGGSGLGINALQAADCDDLGATIRYAPVRRRDSDTIVDFYLIAHTDRNQARMLVYLEGKFPPVSQRCTKLSSSGSIAFDAKCRVPGQAFKEGSKTVLVIRLPNGQLRREPVAIVPF